MKKYIFPLLLLWIPLKAQTIMKAEDAITIGLKNNYDIQIAKNNRQISDNNAGKGTAEFLPTLAVSANHQYASSLQETNSPFSFGDSKTRSTGGQISIDWTLFDGFKMFTTNRRFRELAKLGEYQARNLIENTSVAILRAYFKVVQQEELLDVAKNSMVISRTRLEKEKVRQELGGASSTDFLNAQVSFNNDSSLVLNQELLVLIAKKDLNILLGRDAITPISVNKQITIIPLSSTIEELLSMARDHNSSLLIAEQNKIVADQDIQITKSSFYPQLLLGADYGYLDRTINSDNPNFTDPVNTQSKDGMIGLTLSFNLFNGMRDKINLQNARLAAKNRNLALQDTKNQLSGLVREKYVTFDKRVELMKLEEQNVIAAQQNLQLQQDRYQIGTSTSLEFRDAQVNLLRAQSTLIAARYQARISRLEIEQLIGRLEIE
jgi:outer membrane protein TolC